MVRLILVTSTSAIFLAPPPTGARAVLWATFWTEVLSSTAKHIAVPYGTPPRVHLNSIVDAISAEADPRAEAAAHEFGTFQVRPNEPPRLFFERFQRSLNQMIDCFGVAGVSQPFARSILLYNVRLLSPDVAAQCQQKDFSQTLAAVQKWAQSQPATQARPTQAKSGLFCSFCRRPGHTVDVCRTKRQAQGARPTQGPSNDNHNNHNNHNKTHPRRKQGATVHLAHNLSPNAAFQLDSGADYHVADNEASFSPYSPCSTKLTGVCNVAIPVRGSGILRVPSLTGELSLRHVPGQSPTLLSTSRLEKDGYTISWSSPKLPVDVYDPSGRLCMRFERHGLHLIWRPSHPHTRPKILAAAADSSRNWHAILGHPGEKALTQALSQANIKGYTPPSSCDTCVKAKLTISRGKGTFRSATTFAEALHMDLVGGRTSLTPAPSDTSQAAATWYLLVVDEWSGYKTAYRLVSVVSVLHTFNCSTY